MRGESIEAREVTKRPARYRKAINVLPRKRRRYHWNSDLQRIVDQCLLVSGDAALAAAVGAAGGRANSALPREIGAYTDASNPRRELQKNNVEFLK